MSYKTSQFSLNERVVKMENSEYRIEPEGESVAIFKGNEFIMYVTNHFEFYKNFLDAEAIVKKLNEQDKNIDES